MSEYREEDPIVDQACAELRRGIGRSKKLAAEARQKLSELTSDGVYAGPAGFILADASAHSEDYQPSPVPTPEER